MNNLVKILNQNGRLVVTSRQVADDFEKEHSKVTRDIEGLIEGIAKNGDTYDGVTQKCAHLFIETQYQHEQNKQFYKEYLLTKDGFSLLIMGFTGTKALQWKLKYIDAFNEMEQALKEQINSPKVLKESKAGGLNGLIKTLNGVMKEEKLPAWKRAEVIKYVSLQFGIDIPEQFISKPEYIQISLAIPVN